MYLVAISTDQIAQFDRSLNVCQNVFERGGGTKPKCSRISARTVVGKLPEIDLLRSRISIDAQTYLLRSAYAQREDRSNANKVFHNRG